MKKSLRLPMIVGAIALFATSLSAEAALGGLPLTGAQTGVSTVSGLHSAMAVRASSDTSAATGYTVNTVSLSSGTVVKEFVSSSTSKVFAVIWHGPVMPNLQLILGDNFSAYASAPTAASASGFRMGGLSAHSVSVNGVVVQSTGSTGHFHGYAYIPADFPTGVTLESLRQKQ
jgi:hypothetical protein